MTNMQIDPISTDGSIGSTSTRHPKILVVDDVQDNLDLIQDLFEGEPWTVRTCDNARDALAEIKQWRPNLVLLDIMMPEFNGHHLCTAVRMNPELDDIPVIFLTAQRTSESDIKRGMKMGACDYICKPIDGDILRKRIRQVLQPIWLKLQQEQDQDTASN